MKSLHFLDFVKIYNKALLIRVVGLDALSAEHRVVVLAVEVLNSFLVIVAEVRHDIVFAVIVKIVN